MQTRCVEEQSIKEVAIGCYAAIAREVIGGTSRPSPRSDRVELVPRNSVLTTMHHQPRRPSYVQALTPRAYNLS